MTNLPKLSGVLAICLALASGCVSKGRYKEDTEALKQQLSIEQEQCRKQSSELEQKLLATAKDKGLLKASLDDMKKAMEEIKARQAEERKRLQEFAAPTKRFKRLTDSGALSVRIVDGKMV